MKRVLLAVVALMVAACSRPVGGPVSIDGSVGVLRGVVELPTVSVKGKLPVCIVFHGLTGFRDEAHLVALSDSLRARGVAVVRFNFNGHGDSDGEFINMTLDNEFEDAKAVFGYVESLPWVDTGRIYVAGHSQGGLEAGLLAGELGFPRVARLLLLAPAALIHTNAMAGRMFETQFAEIPEWFTLEPVINLPCLTGSPEDSLIIARADSTLMAYKQHQQDSLRTWLLSQLPDTVAFWGGYFKLARGYMESAVNCDVYGRTAQYSGPVCIVQGLNDDPTLITSAEAYLDYLPQALWFPLPGFSHCFPEDLSVPAEIGAKFLTE